MTTAACNGKINVLIRFTSILAARGMQSLLLLPPAEFRAEIATDIFDTTQFRPDIILADPLSLMVADKRRRNAKLVLMDWGSARDEIIGLLITHKIDGVIEPETDLPLFRKALNTIHSGQVWIENGKLKALLHDENLGTKPAAKGLSKKEREIVLLVAEGLKNRQIGERLHISEQTVKAHLNHIFRKEGVSSRAQLVPLALRLQVRTD